MWNALQKDKKTRFVYISNNEQSLITMHTQRKMAKFTKSLRNKLSVFTDLHFIVESQEGQEKSEI